MNFFEHQDRARRNTTVLIVLFAVAVLCIIASIFGVTQVFFAATESGGSQGFQWQILLFVAAGTLLIVGGGSLYKVHQLSAGGTAVATLLGARPIQSSTDDLLEKQYFNVVEETAIASGTPVPGVYVMDGEPGINAFAAGYTPSDAVIAVTRGCMEQLNRDELQGVVAHEFSHILNGDMRLNIRLMGVLHGILCIALAGYMILRGSMYGGHRVSSSRGKGGGGAGAILAMGAALVAIGYIGVFFAKLIKAAVSRQREFLADASAVQFTRNPTGIANALKKIGGLGSRLRSPQAESASHMLFGNGLAKSMFATFATHPPLEERIRRIDKYAARQMALEKAGVAEPSTTTQAPAPKPTAAGAGANRGPGGFGIGIPGIPEIPGMPNIGAGPAPLAGLLAAVGAVAPDAVVEQVGNPTTEHARFTRDLLKTLPLAISTGVHEPFTARAVIYGLLLDPDPSVRRHQLRELQGRTDSATLHDVVQLTPLIKNLKAEMRLPLVDLALPALREMSPRQFEQFSRNVQDLIDADSQLTMFEFALQKVLMRHLAGSFRRRARQRIRYDSLERVWDDCKIVLSVLARAGHDSDKEVREAFAAGAKQLPSSFKSLELAQKTECGIWRLDEALSRLAQTTAACKRSVLLACAHAAAHDGKLWPWEGEILRAVADTLDCPIPPLVGGLA